MYSKTHPTPSTAHTMIIFCRRLERYAALREINKRAKTAIDEALLLICSFETKLKVSFIKTLERECRGLDRDGSGMLKVKELVEAIDRSIHMKLSQSEVRISINHRSHQLEA